MRKIKNYGNFFVTLLINMLLNVDALIIVVCIFALHFIFGLPVWLGFVALGIFVLSIVIRMWLFGWLSDCANQQDPPKENKNPYSLKNSDILPEKKK